MFYVEKLHRDNKKELAMIHIGPPIIVLIAFLSITVWTWLDATQTVEQTRRQNLSAHMEETETNIQDRINSYEDILRSGSGLFKNSSNVSRTDWKNFIETFDINTRYPGLQGIGYAEIIQPNQLPSHEAKYRDKAFSNYNVYPTDERSPAVSVVYLEPQSPENNKAIGYNMYSDQARRNAINQAQTTGEPTISEVVTLVQDKDDRQQPGFLMFVPVYRLGTELKTEQDRQKNSIGFIFAAFRSNDLLAALTRDDPAAGYAFQIYAKSSDSDSLLYQTPNFSAIESGKTTTFAEETITLNNQEWIVKGTVDDAVISGNEASRPTTILVLGVIFSVLLSFLIYILIIDRTRALANKETLEIQNAKDELLALASHQLRTPATGVKQYLGLLREGYAGPLNKDQRLYIKKAYESNERQLNTINQMLFVARSDAGKIKLTIRHLDIGALLRDILEEQRSSLKEKRHKLKTDIPDHPVDLYGDEQYLRMAFENIIGNAIKYTEEGGKISVSVAPAGKDVKITVEDNGVGVNQEDLPLLFRKFSRIPNELTSKVAGSGIGLYLTKSIIKAHNGRISFESVVNIGSSVTIILPSKLPKDHIGM